MLSPAYQEIKTLRSTGKGDAAYARLTQIVTVFSGSSAIDPTVAPRDALLAVERAEPELVRGAGADLRDEQQGREAFCQRTDGLEGGWGVFDGKDELTLEFVSVARGELVPEVRQPVQPQAGFVQLRRAVFRRHFR